METEYNDNMHQLIVDRLKERSRKLDVIRDCEMTSKKHRYVSFAGWAVAACLVGFVVLSVHNTFDGSDNMSGDVIRSGNLNVDELVKEKKYEEALKMIDVELSKSDSAIKVLQMIPTDELDEESEYELQVERQKHNELKKKIKILKKKLK